jgi:hypothetical protein
VNRKKATVDPVAQVAADDPVKAFLQHHAEERLSGCPEPVQQQTQHGRRRKLGLQPEPTIQGIVSPGHAP